MKQGLILVLVFYVVINKNGIFVVAEKGIGANGNSPRAW
jgi:hypothetical protein